MPTRHEFARIRRVAEKALDEARGSQGDFGAVNWGDLGVVETLHCQDEYGRASWRILIEEASPDCGLASLVYAAVKGEFPDEAFDVATEW